MEALACGLPTIGTRGLGNESFLNESTCLLVSAAVVDVPEAAAAEIPVYRGHRWLEPDVGELRSAMRRVFRDRRLRRTIAVRGAAEIRKRFSPTSAQQALEENLCAAESRFRTSAAPQVVRCWLLTAMISQTFGDRPH